MDFNMISVDLEPEFVSNIIIARLNKFVDFFMDLLDNTTWQDSFDSK